jgi:hypothetical protein
VRVTIEDGARQRVEPVSVAMRTAKARAEAKHVTIGQVVQRPDGLVTIACSCGMELTNGPTWSLDEHIRLHRAEARFLELADVAPAAIPRLVKFPVALTDDAGPARDA